MQTKSFSPPASPALTRLGWFSLRIGRAHQRWAVGLCLTLAGLPVCSPANDILNSANSFAVLGGSTVTSAGNTVLNGDLGVSPGGAITGFGPGIVNGTTYQGDTVAQQAQLDVSSAFALLGNETSLQDLTGQNLGGLTLVAGVRNFNTTAQLTGILTLDAQGDPLARFDFLIGSTLTTAASSQVLLINGAQADNVFWRIGTVTTLGSDTVFSGNILADQSITLNTGASVSGRVLAINGAVTLVDNNVTLPVSVPEPATSRLLIFCAALAAAWLWKKSPRPRTHPQTSLAGANRIKPAE